jgi:hypothetical protein
LEHRGAEVKTGQVLEKLMAFIYDEYNQSDAFKSYGEFASAILSRFCSQSGIELGTDEGARIEYMRLLQRKGWIEVVSPRGKSQPGARLDIISMIKPTPEGIAHVEQGRDPGGAILGGAKVVAEIIGRFVKGLLGR